jgi:uncharacterized protein (DUF1015 family)
MKTYALTPCLLGVLAVAGSVVSSQVPAERDRIDRRIAEIQPTRKEKRFDEIGWVKGLREAERLAKKSGRPVFLFSNVGDLDIGRC